MNGCCDQLLLLLSHPLSIHKTDGAYCKWKELLYYPFLLVNDGFNGRGKILTILIEKVCISQFSVFTTSKKLLTISVYQNIGIFLCNEVVLMFLKPVLVYFSGFQWQNVQRKNVSLLACFKAIILKFSEVKTALKPLAGF